jgi:hypothetical protein
MELFAYVIVAAVVYCIYFSNVIYFSNIMVLFNLLERICRVAKYQKKQRTKSPD